jgi:hypothetical protein
MDSKALIALLALAGAISMMVAHRESNTEVDAFASFQKTLE